MDFNEINVGFKPTEEQNQMIKEAFDLYSNDSNGFIERKNMRGAMIFLGLEFTKEEFKKVMQLSGSDQINLINFQQFSKTMNLAFKEMKTFDYNQPKTKYSFEQLKELSIELGENLPDDEIKEIFYSQEKSDEITEEEFIRIMSNSNFPW